MKHISIHPAQMHFMHDKNATENVIKMQTRNY